MSNLRKRIKAPFRAWSLRRSWREEVDESALERETVSAVIVTYNRRQFLAWCLESFFATVDFPGLEVLVWNNASVDGTRELLEEYEAQGKLRAIHAEKNIGTNAYKPAFEEATGSYFLEMDDDVLWFPQGWLRKMLRCFQQLPGLGFLSASQITDRYVDASQHPLTGGRFFYNHVTFPGGTRIAFGPAQGHCALTPRAIYEEVGGFPSEEGHVITAEDGHYNRAMRKAGYLRGILEDVEVYHATGPHCNYAFWEVFRAKMQDAYALNAPAAPPPIAKEDVIPGFLEHFRATYRDEAAEA